MRQRNDGHPTPVRNKYWPIGSAYQCTPRACLVSPRPLSLANASIVIGRKRRERGGHECVNRRRAAIHAMSYIEIADKWRPVCDASKNASVGTRATRALDRDHYADKWRRVRLPLVANNVHSCLSVKRLVVNSYNSFTHPVSRLLEPLPFGMRSVTIKRHPGCTR